jgi:membrane-bound lytic murein transglycosylase B
MRTKRVHTPTRNTAGSHFARRTSGRRLIPASTAARLSPGGRRGPRRARSHRDRRRGGRGAADGQRVASADPRPTRGALRASTAQSSRRASRAPDRLDSGVVDPAVKPYLTPKLLAAVPVGPGPVSKPVQMVLTSPGVTTALDDDGIPEVALEAYQHAASALAINDPSCHLPWQLVAAIGRVESDDGRFGGAMLLSNGDTTRPILGIPLDGRPGVALVRDTDGNIAEAEGPMQFLPSTWAEYGVDGNGDGKADINNVFDAALAAGDFLCAGGGDMNDPAQQAAAVFRYNDADEYVHAVLALSASYENGMPRRCR